MRQPLRVRQTGDTWSREGHKEEVGWLAYFSQLLSYKDALKSVRYSLNDESLSRTLRFKPWLDSDSPEIEDHDETYIELPADTKYVAVQLTYLDGTQSETK